MKLSRNNDLLLTYRTYAHDSADTRLVSSIRVSGYLPKPCGRRRSRVPSSRPDPRSSVVVDVSIGCQRTATATGRTPIVRAAGQPISTRCAGRCTPTAIGAVTTCWKSIRLPAFVDRPGLGAVVVGGFEFDGRTCANVPSSHGREGERWRNRDGWPEHASGGRAHLA